LEKPVKRLLLVLVPMALFAQVEIDTVIRLSSYLRNGFFIPGLNGLYVLGEYEHYVVNCSTYQLQTQYPRPEQMGTGLYAWNWRRGKLYISVNPGPEDSTLIADADADSVIGWLTLKDGSFHLTYLSDVDRLYWNAVDTAYLFDCAADTVVRRITSPLPAYHIGQASWDSVGRKLYVSLGYWMGPSLLAVYDYVADSFTKTIDVSSVALGNERLVFDHARHRAFLGPSAMGGYVGIIDTEHDTLLRVLPSYVGDGTSGPIAVNEREGKAYIASNFNHPGSPETLWVVDCATDSIVKRIEYTHRGYGALCARWVPWSNRIYLGCQTDLNPSTPETSIVVLDCETDSIIARLVLGHEMLDDIQLDPIRERIFAIGIDSTNIYVLRDSGYGVAESKRSGPRPSGLQVQIMAGWFDIRYSVAAPCRVDLAVYDLMGREVRRLVAERQPAGQHSVAWNSQDLYGNRAARGVYFIRLDTPGFGDVKKAVVAR